MYIVRIIGKKIARLNIHLSLNKLWAWIDFKITNYTNEDVQ